MPHPHHKSIRLKDYDYSQNGAYFVTICVNERQNLLSNIVIENGFTAPIMDLTEMGIEAEKTIQYLNGKYENAFDKYVIMPNHLHCIIVLEMSDGNPLLYDIVKQLKTYTTKRYNEIHGTKTDKLWQRNYYEHVIRNEMDYRAIWQYIDDNPAKWLEDEYY